MTEEQFENIIDQTTDWFERDAGYNDIKEAKAIIGISGGKDSSVVAALCAKILGPENVIGILMPNGVQTDIQDSVDLVNTLGINHITVNICTAFSDIIGRLSSCFDDNCSWTGNNAHVVDNDRVTTNLPARLRMCVEYAVANHINGRVIGTGNKAEDMVGYFSIYGDSACDYQPLKNLWVDEVIELGRYLGVPERFLIKPPSDGMCGKTDEESLGFKYSELKDACTFGFSGDPSQYTELSKKIYDKLYKATQKRKLLLTIPGPVV